MIRGHGRVSWWHFLPFKNDQILSGTKLQHATKELFHNLTSIFRKISKGGLHNWISYLPNYPSVPLSHVIFKYQWTIWRRRREHLKWPGSLFINANIEYLFQRSESSKDKQVQATKCLEVRQKCWRLKSLDFNDLSKQHDVLWSVLRVYPNPLLLDFKRKECLWARCLGVICNKPMSVWLPKSSVPAYVGTYCNLDNVPLRKQWISAPMTSGQVFSCFTLPQDSKTPTMHLMLGALMCAQVHLVFWQLLRSETSKDAWAETCVSLLWVKIGPLIIS